jgi:hypothetical protein
MEDLELLSVKELQDKLVELGMPEDDVAAFKTKAPLIASIKTLQTKDAEKTVEVAEKVEEVKKVASITEKPNPVEDRMVNKAWKAKAEAMRRHLEKQEDVSIILPLEPGEKPGVVETRTDKYGYDYQVAVSGAVETIQLNGLKILIPKGTYTKVKRQVAEIIARSQQQTLEAGRDVEIDRIDPATGRPVREML